VKIDAGLKGEALLKPARDVLAALLKCRIQGR
jgi:hypothetical protein